MKKVLIAAVAATSMIAGIGAAQADGTDAMEQQNFKDRAAHSNAPSILDRQASVRPGARADRWRFWRHARQLRAARIRADAPATAPGRFLLAFFAVPGHRA